MPNQSETVRQVLSTMPDDARFVFDLDRLKELERQSPLSIGSRRELVGEHSWHVAVAVPLLAHYSPVPIDVPHATLLATIHDVVELLVGDTFAFGDQAASKDDREHAAMKELSSRTGSDSIRRLVALWEEYERQDTPEANFVKGLDAFLPIAMNFSNLENSSWKQHAVAASSVQKRLDRVRNYIGPLAEINDSMIQTARTLGYLS